MYKADYTTPVQEDLVSILEYILSILKAQSAAKSESDEIEKETGILTENPLIFPISQDKYIAKYGIRHMSIKNYYIFYTIDENAQTVSIIRILYARRDWINLFKREP